MSDKRYKITITEYATENTLTSRKWEQGGPDGRRKDEDDNPNAWGYTPQIEQRSVVERTVYSQNTDNLDLGEVIKAVNGL